MTPTTPETEAPATADVPAAEPPPSLKRFLLQAVLWLPLAFFLWYVLRLFVVAPAVQLAGAWLTGWMPELFARLPGCDPAEDALRCGTIGQSYHMFVYYVVADVGGAPDMPAPALEVMLQANALMYCYGVAVLVGLVMATPLDWKRTFAQIGGGLLALIPLQAFSLVGDALKSVGYDLAPAVSAGLSDAGYGVAAMAAGASAAGAAQAVLASHGLTAEVIGLWYQFGYLIVPPIVPVVVWILFNRRFIESLGVRLAPLRGTRRRPRGPSAP
jgi:hypothetical protein